MSLSLTNGQIANLIDALRVAIRYNRECIKSETPTEDAAQAREHVEMNAEIIRWRALRKLLLEHERNA